MRNGIFITFEGPDGSGKTTISTYVCEQLSARGYDVIYSREPGGIEIAEQIRNIILDPKNTAMDAKTEALLYAASRRQHFVEKIKPALNAGKIVICDRFVESSLAYQGCGRQIGIDEIYQLNQFAIEGCLPEMTLFLDISPEDGLKRIETRANKDRLDQETTAFHKRVYEGYQEVLRRYRERMCVIDASQDEQSVKAEALSKVLEYIQKMSSAELKETQSVVYRILSQSLLEDNVSQGYLFVGDTGAPMLETAKLLAKSILCTHRKLDGFACEECDSCRRVENGNFTDLLILDGTESSIKKEMILQVRDTFSKTALEAYGKKVYIVNACENATPEALNSLLKFLEEPSDDVYAILITYRIESLLDTIISRVQNVKFKPLNVEQCVKQCIDMGVASEDANILSRIMANPELVNEITLQNTYIMIKSFVLEFLALFLKSEDLATIELQKFIRKNKNLGKSEYVLLLDMLIVYCKECIAKSFEGEDIWDSLVEKGSARDCHSYMRVLLESKDEFQRYPNAALMFDKIMYRLKKGA